MKSSLRNKIKQFSLNSFWGKMLAFLIFVGVFVYLVLRAIYVPLCSDEAATYLTFISDGRFIPYVNQLAWSANNHLLNSALAWVSVNVFGLSEFALRLPTVLSFVLYAWFAFRISLLLKRLFLQWLLYVLLVLGSHYMLEFFAYTRGYGLGLCFLLGAIYYLFQYINSKQRYAFLWLGLLCIVLATLANLGLIITFAIWLFFAFVAVLQSQNVKQKVAFILVSLVPLSFLVTYAMRLRSGGELYYGQETLFGTSWSLFVNLVQGASFSNLQFFNAFVLLTVGVAIVILVKNGLFKLSPLHVAASLFIGNVAAAIAMHMLLGVIFPSERTALHWLFLYLLLVPFVLDELNGLPSKIGIFLSGSLTVLILVASFSRANLHVSGEAFWAKEQIPSSFYSTIIDLDQADGFRHSISGQNIFYGYVLSFQNHKNKNTKVDFCQSFNNKPTFLADLSIADVKAFPEMLTVYEPLLYDEYSTMTLLKRKHYLARDFVADSSVIKDAVSDEFVGLFTHRINAENKDLSGEDLRLEVDIDVATLTNYFDGAVIISCTDADGNHIFYDQINAFLFPKSANNERNIKLSYALNDVPKNAQNLNVYLWNNYKLERVAIRSNVKVFQLRSQHPKI